MKLEKKMKKKRPMSVKKKIVLGVLAVAACVALVAVGIYLFKYRLYRGYEKYLKGYEYEQGTEFAYAKEAVPSVEGFKLVCENETLKLYLDPVTTFVAIYDKRSGEITYSNPLDGKDDKKANSANKNFLQSQLVVYYYNSHVSSNYMDNYSKSIKTKQFKFEGIQNGVRIIYTIGETKPIVNPDTGEETENTYFEIPLEYRLDGDSVVASVPTRGIVEHGNCYVYRIHLLRNFGCGTLEDEGYIVVPNGSGSIIRFNTEKKNVTAYAQSIYDVDPMVASYTAMENTSPARLPYYGISKGNTNILATVEGGASFASINAYISGMMNSYNFAFPIYTIRNSDNLANFGNATTDVNVMEEDMYDANLSVRFTFMDSEHKGYSGMATYIREKLIAEGKLEQLQATTDIPFYYDIISGVKETAHFLGAQYLHTFAMTTFDEAGEIADELAAKGVKNQVMNLQGWFNGGYYNDAPHDIRVTSKLGGRSGLSDLNSKMKELNSKLYADVLFQKISFGDKHFNYKSEGSRYYGSGYVAAFGLLDPTALRNTGSLNYYENRYDLLSPKFLNRYVDKFTKKFAKVDVDGIGLRDLGNTLVSDKFHANITDREQALNIVVGQFDTIAKTGKNVLIDSPNGYAMTYADDIINVPYKGNDFFICDESIPFYQMILHGYVNYSSEILNDENEDHFDELILHLLETGTSPHFQFTKQEASEMKETGLNRFYSTTFDVMEATAVELYNDVNAVLKNVTNATIVNHEISGDLRAVTYSNGVVIYINYGNYEGTVNGVTVPAKSYRTEGI